MTLDRTFLMAENHVAYAQQELLRTRQLSSSCEDEKRGLRSMLQRSFLLGENKVSTDFGTRLCDYFDIEEKLKCSRDALATQLTIALTFVVEALNLMINEGSQYDTPLNRIKVRNVISKVRSVLSDYDARSIPKDGIASALTRGETLARMVGNSKYADIRDLLKGMRQSIAYY